MVGQATERCTIVLRRVTKGDDMAASEAVVGAVESDHLLGDRRFLKKADALEASLERMAPTEELRVCGIARMAYEESDMSDTYYLITNIGTHFALTRKAGFMKKEDVPTFVPHADIAHCDALLDAASILRCYRAGEEKHFLFFSFYLSSFKGGEAAELAQVAEALGQVPIDTARRR
jgi:hypothetical protein